MILNFSESEMGMIISSLDFYMRMYIGQYREILYDLRWYRDCSYLDDLEDQLRIKFMQIRNILLPGITGYGWSGSYGIFNPDVDYRAGIAYDMMQVFRNKLAYFKHPEGGITVDFNPLMHCENDPYDFPSARCSKQNGKVYAEININNEHLEIILNALKINNAKYNCRFRELFSYYTKDEAALRVADEITVILKDIPEDKKIKYNNQEIDLLNNIRKQYDTIVKR